MRTLEQLRAADALGRVAELAGRSDEFKKSYRSYVERLGPAIVMNGLGQALASESAAAGPPPKGGEKGRGRREEGDAPAEKAKAEAHRQLYQNLHVWLCRREGGVYPGEGDILKAIVEHDEAPYLRAQAESIAWLEWHKKFCRATFPRGERE